MADDPGKAAVEAWVERTLGADGNVVRVPHLSTARYGFYVVSQPRLAAGETYAMSDGDEVLPAGRESLARVLEREGVRDDPGALPAAQLAELYVRMVDGRRLRVLEDASDFALEDVSAEGFTPPAARSVEDGVAIEFWTTGPEPSRVERWNVRVAPGGTITDEHETVS